MSVGHCRFHEHLFGRDSLSEPTVDRGRAPVRDAGGAAGCAGRGGLRRAAPRDRAARGRTVASVGRDRAPRPARADGFLSAAAWLVSRSRSRAPRASGFGSPARDHAQDATRARGGRGLDVGDPVLVAVRDASADAFERCEPQLVEAARIHSVSDLQRAVFWREAVEREQALGGEDRLHCSALHASVSLLGMVAVDGDLDPETGESLLTALRAVLDADAFGRDGRPDARATQGRCARRDRRQWLDLAERPTVAGERPHVTVTVDAICSASRRRGAGSLITPDPSMSML